ncbi:hypothetical protein DRF62_09885 [Chryseobacterium piscium]|uniref:DUF7674 domain-containing protein n=2 Tax=Chryseobacterium group TaxID=2782232 RepID=A0A3D9BLQ3_9FLAO|nr:hypothetical protein DRF62_09885 [Chryseobacterium piscium]
MFAFLKGTNLGISTQNNLKMNHTDAVREIVKVIPESQEEFEESYKTKTPFMVISVFTKQIKKLIKDHDQKILMKSITKMNLFYSKGDQALKNAIENIFVYSLDSLTFCCEPSYKDLIFAKMSPSLQNNYLRQVYKSGI